MATTNTPTKKRPAGQSKPMKLRAGTYKGYYFLAPKGSPKNPATRIPLESPSTERFKFNLIVERVNADGTFSALFRYQEHSGVTRAEGELSGNALLIKEIESVNGAFPCALPCQYKATLRDGEMLGKMHTVPTDIPPGFASVRGGFRFLDNLLKKEELHPHHLIEKSRATKPGQHWTCQNCKREDQPRRWRCFNRCGFSVCNICVSEVVSHLHQHPLVQSSVSKDWKCSKCGVPDQPKRYRCNNGHSVEDRCNFALCQTCVALQPDRRTTHLHPGHVLKEHIQFGDQVRRWKCHVCQRADQPKRFTCEQKGCVFDMCLPCILKQPKIIKAQVHPHTLSQVFQSWEKPTKWTCHHCGKENGPRRWRCTEGCDFDVCDLCKDQTERLPDDRIASADYGHVEGAFVDRPSYAQPTLAYGFRHDAHSHNVVDLCYDDTPGPAHYGHELPPRHKHVRREKVPDWQFRSGTERFLSSARNPLSTNLNVNSVYQPCTPGPGNYQNIFDAGHSSFSRAMTVSPGPRLGYDVQRGTPTPRRRTPLTDELFRSTRDPTPTATPDAAVSSRPSSRTASAADKPSGAGAPSQQQQQHPHIKDFGVRQFGTSPHHPRHLQTSQSKRERSPRYSLVRPGSTNHAVRPPSPSAHPQQRGFTPEPNPYNSYTRGTQPPRAGAPLRSKFERRDTFLLRGRQW